MSNLYKFFKDEKAFTLIELLIVIVISAVVIFSIGNLISSSSSFFFQDNERIEIQRELRFITNYIDENLKFADQVEAAENKPSLNSGEFLIYLENSRLIIEDSSSNTRKISDIIIDNFSVSSYSNSSKLDLNINHVDGFSINTSILLNNHRAETGVTSGGYIKFKK